MIPPPPPPPTSTPRVWTQVADLDDWTMARAAGKRALVQLDTGRIVTLVKWPVHGHTNAGRRGKGRFARLATRADTRFNLACARIVLVELPVSPEP
jgi:hypothetical protein